MIALIFIYYFLIRLYPYFFSPVPVGYDPGLYLYLFRQYSHVSPLAYTALPDWLLTVYPPLVPFLVRMATPFVAPEQMLIPLILLASMTLFISVYYSAKMLYDKKTAIVALGLMTLSIVQYRLYWYYYLKNIFALALLVILIPLYRKQSKIAWIIAPAIILMHQPTSIFLGLLLIVPLFQKKASRYHAVSIGLTLMAFMAYYLPNFQTTLAPFLPGFIKGLIPSAESGTFFNFSEALLYMAPYIPLAVFTMWKEKFETYPEIGVMLIASVLSSLGMFLSRRFIPFLDIFLILLAAPVLSRMSKKIQISVFVILIGMNIWYVKTNSGALILTDEYREIQMLRTTEPESYILVADNEYTPWVYGYSLRKPITPGFGEYDVYWTNDEWNQFWMSGDPIVEQQLLSKLPKPLYIYTGDKDRLFKFKPTGACFEKTSWHVHKFVCE